MLEQLNHPATYVIATVAVIVAILRIGMWVGSVSEHKTTVTKFMDEIRDKIDQILVGLSGDVLRGKSPVQLTELGKKVSEDLSAKDWAKRIVPSIRSSVANKEPYEIHDFCYDYVRNTLTLNDEQEAVVRRTAYENGIERFQVLNVLAVELRDSLLAERNEDA